MDFVKSATGTYVHDDEHFFPLDGQGWNDTRIGLLATPFVEAGDGCDGILQGFQVLNKG